MPLDASSPFRLSFGRGSGWKGLDTVTIEKTGQTVIHRRRVEGPVRKGKQKVMVEFWERTGLELNATSLQRLGQALIKGGVPGMARSYRADVHDGTQWILQLQQGTRVKTFYCDNHFPSGIQDFAASLDAELNQSGLAQARWERVPESQERSHEKALWKSIQQVP